jgi:four helix bundle protein
LDVFKLAYRRALEVHQFCGNLPKNEQFGGIGDQLRRSSKSVCANMAEGLSKMGSKPEEIRFLRIALGSCEESRLWLRFCTDLGYLEQGRADIWRDEYERIRQMVLALIKKREAV